MNYYETYFVLTITSISLSPNKKIVRTFTRYTMEEINEVLHQELLKLPESKLTEEQRIKYFNNKIIRSNKHRTPLCVLTHPEEGKITRHYIELRQHTIEDCYGLNAIEGEIFQEYI